MNERECVPYAPVLIESMRSLGYSFYTAIADLLDNSISAHAKTISILTMPGTDPFLVIVDDGNGMSKDELYEAMRYGSSNPLLERAVDDLGRFGLGLKAASLSQCRRLVVASKKNGCIYACAWDLDYVIQKQGVWALQCFDEEDFDALLKNNIMLGKNRPMFSMGKLIKMAGNSIVVNVLEAIFIQSNEIHETFFEKGWV